MNVNGPVSTNPPSNLPPRLRGVGVRPNLKVRPTQQTTRSEAPAPPSQQQPASIPQRYPRLVRKAPRPDIPSPQERAMLAAKTTKSTGKVVLALHEIGTGISKGLKASRGLVTGKSAKMKHTVKGGRFHIGLSVTSIALNILGLGICIANLSNSIKRRGRGKKLIQKYKKIKNQDVSYRGLKRDYYGKKVAGKSIKKRGIIGAIESSGEIVTHGGLLLSSSANLAQLISTSAGSSITAAATAGGYIFAPLWILYASYSGVRSVSSLRTNSIKLKMIKRQIAALEKKPELTNEEVKKLKLLRYARRKFLEKNVNNKISLVVDVLSFTAGALTLASIISGPGAAFLGTVGAIFFVTSAIGALSSKAILYAIRRRKRLKNQKLPSNNPNRYVNSPEMKKEILESLEKDKYTQYDFKNKRLDKPDDWSANELAVFFLMGNKLGEDRKAREKKYPTEDQVLSPVERFSREDQLKLGFLESPDHFWNIAFSPS